jgi:hypothetical protein
MTSTGKIWWIDPVNGKTPAAGGDGSQAHPCNSLAGIISGNWGTAGFSRSQATLGRCCRASLTSASSPTRGE